MKPSELRDKTDDELRDLEKDLRDQLVRLGVAKATQQSRNTAQFSRIKHDIARIQTIARERQLGLGGSAGAGAPAAAGEG